MRKRDFLAAGLGLGAGLAASAALSPVLGQGAPAAGRGAAGGGRGRVQTAKAKTTRLFRSPGNYPNGLAVAPEGLWIGQQKVTPGVARDWGVAVPANRDEDAWLVDWNGKLLRTVSTPCRNCSGTGFGGGSLWMASNESPRGIFQIDAATGRTIRERQIPLALDAWGGGCHGLQWQNGKLWIAALRLGGALRVDPVTWVPEVLIRVASEEKPRLHDITFDANGDMWVVTGTSATSYAAASPGLNKYDGKTGQLIMTVDFEPGSADPHGLVFYNGKLISCDAGNHPGWKENESPHSGYIFSIDMI
jgi:sugar lactone lactonase YvrE